MKETGAAHVAPWGSSSSRRAQPPRGACPAPPRPAPWLCCAGSGARSEPRAGLPGPGLQLPGCLRSSRGVSQGADCTRCPLRRCGAPHKDGGPSGTPHKDGGVSAPAAAPARGRGGAGPTWAGRACRAEGGMGAPGFRALRCALRLAAAGAQRGYSTWPAQALRMDYQVPLAAAARGAGAPGPAQGCPRGQSPRWGLALSCAVCP